MMSTSGVNLLLPQSGVAWAFKLPVIKHLFEAYTKTSFYKFLENLPATTRVDFIRAGKNQVWTPDVLQQFEALQSARRSVVST